MTSIPIPSTRVPQLLQYLGELIGLLSPEGDNIDFDLDWFGDVVNQLEAAPGRGKPQLDMLRELLGKPAGNTPDGEWYPLGSEGGTPAYVVVRPKGATDSAVIGVGICDKYVDGSASVLGGIFAPVFAVPIGTPLLLTGRAEHPIEVTASVALGTTVSPPGLSFDGFDLVCDVFVSDSDPHFTATFTKSGKPQGEVLQSLRDLMGENGAAWINALLPTGTVSKWLARPIGSSSVKAGEALAFIGVLDASAPAPKAAAGAPAQDATYKLGDLSGLVSKSPVQIAEMLLQKGLDKLAQKDPVAKIGSGGIWVFKAAGEGGASDYGLRLTIPDIDVSPEQGPSIKVQFGALLEGDTDDSNWVSRCANGAATASPGLSLTLLHEDSSSVPSFRAKLDLVSIGFDVAGTRGNALIDVEGVTLDAIQPRFLFSYDFQDAHSLYWGLAAEAQGLGLPLANGLTGNSGNPVAQNLLSGGPGGGDSEAINPSFSLAMAGMSGPSGAKPFDVKLISNTISGDTVWIPMQRAFGPLQCRRIGLAWPDPNPDKRLNFLFDGSVTLSALEVDLMGLSLGIPVTSPGDLDSYALDLQGLNVSLDTGAVSIDGGLIKAATSPIEYDGTARISAAGWSISAMGSYADLNGQPSMFIFAQLGAEIGGPPFFFVTGLCAGFGYNRSLRIPTQDEVPSFPLLAGIADPSQVGGPNATPAQALASLSSWIAPAQGVDWIAAGVQFTSFELVQSNVVVTAQITQDPQVAILGVSRIKLAQSGPQFAYAELGIEVVIRPSGGYIGASAVLAPASYLLTPDCHLTGGFAFWIWYSGQHAGDFVITLGGYHPAFVKPPHYPDEARLGFSWHVGGDVTIQGDSYFALTPSCAMGGGALDVLFQSGDLRAWLTAQSDFLFTWKPFYFRGGVGVSIGASYKIDLLFTSFTVSVELGADLEIWGPPTGGNVHIDWYIISFSIGFGADPRDDWPQANFEDWTSFTSLLPNQNKPAAARLAAFAVAEDPVSEGLITVSLSAGSMGNDGTSWLVRGDAAVFAVSTPIPATQATFDAAGTPFYTAPSNQQPGGANALGVRPMGATGVTSVLNITLVNKEGPVALAQGWSRTNTIKGVPAALWGAPVQNDGKPASPSTPSADSLPDWFVGITGLTPPAPAAAGPGPMPIDALGYFQIDEGDTNWLATSPAEAPVNRQPVAAPASLGTIHDTIVATAGARTGLFAALAAMGYDTGTDGEMAELAADIAFSYPDPPMLGAPWRAAA